MNGIREYKVGEFAGSGYKGSQEVQGKSSPQLVNLVLAIMSSFSSNFLPSGEAAYVAALSSCVFAHACFDVA